MPTVIDGKSPNGDGELPPHSPTDEQGILGCILLSPKECIPECLAAFGARPEVFYDLRYQVIYDTLIKMHAAGYGIDAITLQGRLKDIKQIDEVGGLAYLASLPDMVPSAANLSYYLETVVKRYAARQIIQTCAEIVRGVKENPENTETIAGRGIEALKFVAAGTGRDRIIKRLDGRKFDMAKPPPEPHARFFIGNIPICTPGNLTAISSAAKSGKSAFSLAMISAAVTDHPERADCLGVRSRNPNGYALIHIDSEQSRFDHHAGICRAVARAHAASLPPWVLSYCLTDFTVAERNEAFLWFLEYGRKQFGGVFASIIDGTADLVLDVNDAEESNAHVAMLHAKAIEYDHPIIGIIHLNPSSDSKPSKTRGHYGSQLERKAETNLQLEREKGGDSIVVWAEKNRRAPIPKNTGPRFAWNPETGMHVSVETLGEINAKKEREELEEIARDLFAEGGSIQRKDIITALTKKPYQMSAATVGRRLKEMVAFGIITCPGFGKYVLSIPA